MKFSAKTEYACLAVLELARAFDSDEPVRIRSIAEEHGIPSRFLVQILLQLKGAGLVNSTRGAAGGYQLAKPPGEWNTYEITCNGKSITVRVNDSAATTWDDCQLPRGHVGLQAEYFVIDFRNLKFKELP